MGNNVSRVSYRTTRPYYAHNLLDYKTFYKLTDIEKVIEPLKVSILEKGFVTVAEYYGLTNGEILAGDGEFGWTDLNNLRIVMGRYGYRLEMPTPYSIKPNDPIQEAIDILRDADEDSLPDAAQDVCDILQGLNK